MQAKTIEMPIPSNQLPNTSDQPFTTPAQAAEGRNVVQMSFPNRVLLSDVPGPHRVILFQRGINPVAVELADHWYLKAHGARRVADGEDLPDEAA